MFLFASAFRKFAFKLFVFFCKTTTGGSMCLHMNVSMLLCRDYMFHYTVSTSRGSASCPECGIINATLLSLRSQWEHVHAVYWIQLTGFVLVTTMLLKMNLVWTLLLIQYWLQQQVVLAKRTKRDPISLTSPLLNRHCFEYMCFFVTRGIHELSVPLLLALKPTNELK